MSTKFTGMDYLRIDIASQFGLDKEQFEDRIDWVRKNEASLEDYESQADDFFRYAAAVQAYRRAQRGEPIGHLVGLDACASGCQILSCLTGCKVGAANTGATGNKRKDVYSFCTKVMNSHLEHEVEYTKKEIKPPFMTVFYGSKMEPVYAFGKDTEELKAFYKSIEETCPGAYQFLNVVDTLWDPDAYSYSWTMPDGFEVLCKVKWTAEKRIEIDTLPGHPTFKYLYKVNEPEEDGRFLHANIVHSVDGYIVRELSARCDYDSRDLLRKAKWLSIRLNNPKMGNKASGTRREGLWLDSGIVSIEAIEDLKTNQDPYAWTVEFTREVYKLVQKILRRPSFHVISVHDEFKCHPNFMFWIRQTYKELLAELAQSSVLDNILSAVAGYDCHFKKLSTDLYKDVLEGEYALA